MGRLIELKVAHIKSSTLIVSGGRQPLFLTNCCGSFIKSKTRKGMISVPFSVLEIFPK